MVAREKRKGHCRSRSMFLWPPAKGCQPGQAPHRCYSQCQDVHGDESWFLMPCLPCKYPPWTLTCQPPVQHTGLFKHLCIRGCSIQFSSLSAWTPPWPHTGILSEEKAAISNLVKSVCITLKTACHRCLTSNKALGLGLLEQTL